MAKTVQKYNKVHTKGEVCELLTLLPNKVQFQKLLRFFFSRLKLFLQATIKHQRLYIIFLN